MRTPGSLQPHTCLMRVIRFGRGLTSSKASRRAIIFVESLSLASLYDDVAIAHPHCMQDARINVSVLLC